MSSLPSITFFGAAYVVDVETLNAVVHKLKEINWIYKEVDEDDMDDVAQEVVETVSNTSSTKGKQ